MADRDVDVLIVGAGAAGAACAETLRAEGFTGSVLLCGRELDAPYDRTLSSKDYLLGRVSKDDALLHPAQWWAEQDIELLTRTSVMKLDTGARTATLQGAGEVGFTHAVFATGAMVRRLRVDGADLDGVHYLRAPGNADAIRADAQDAERVVLIGGSFIACEVAAGLTTLGKQCTLVMLEDAPLAVTFGARVGEWASGLLRDHGVELVTGDGLDHFAGDGDRVARVVTASGRELEADLVVMGTGAVPDVMAARAAGLELGEAGGVACGPDLATSAPGVWAAGDVCEYESVLHGRRLRVEHWEVARAQGATVARNIIGTAEPFSEVPYFWSDIADWATLESVGPAQRWDEEEVRGDPSGGGFSVLYREGGALVGAVTVGRSEDLDEARALMLEHAGLDPAS